MPSPDDSLEKGPKSAFLKCLEETCENTGWIVHAWCLMGNPYHLAVETPLPNLAEGMRWLQGTFAASGRDAFKASWINHKAQDVTPFFPSNGFQSHLGAIATSEHGTIAGNQTMFQSHLGAIATQKPNLTARIDVVVSKPLGCDSDVRKVQKRLTVQSSFKATWVR